MRQTRGGKKVGQTTKPPLGFGEKGTGRACSILIIVNEGGDSCAEGKWGNQKKKNSRP